MIVECETSDELLDLNTCWILRCATSCATKPTLGCLQDHTVPGSRDNFVKRKNVNLQALTKNNTRNFIRSRNSTGCVR